VGRVGTEEKSDKRKEKRGEAEELRIVGVPLVGALENEYRITNKEFRMMKSGK